MKKTVKTLTLKTDKIVSLTKENAQGIVGGAKSGKTAAVLSVCWCND
ncbi:MAG: class I lanthipeptide [Spirosomataceae bacterium]